MVGQVVFHVSEDHNAIIVRVMQPKISILKLHDPEDSDIMVICTVRTYLSSATL
jgi:hypothetical protein